MKKILILGFLFFSSFAFSADSKKPMTPTAKKESSSVATFAGGCFWCMQPSYDKLIGQGVIKTTVGFSGGDEKNPTYEQVSTGKTKFVEAIQIEYDASKITFDKLLDIYWDNIDPTDSGGQFADRGPQYRPVIFYHNDEQKKIAEKSRRKLDESKEYSKPAVVVIEAYKNFYAAEDYHQKYYDTNSDQYHLYKKGSGRESFIEQHQK